MKERVISVIETKSNEVTILFLIIMFIITTGMMSVSKKTEQEYIKDSFYKSVNYIPTKDLLSFKIPEKVPSGYKFYLHISGSMYMGNKSDIMSFHAFEEESQNYSWIKGKRYTYPLKSDGLVECLLVFGLIDKNNQEILYDIHVFPDGTKSIE